jgi:hypothetical protein
MSRRRDEWRAEVIRSARISDAVRVVLLVLADTMTDGGYVSVPRSALAKTINRSPHRITERLKLAREAGYLAIVRPAMPNRTAEYVATLPDLSGGAPVRTSRRGTPVRTSEVRSADPIQVPPSAPQADGVRGADGGTPNARASTTATEERSDGESADADESRCRQCERPQPGWLLATRNGMCIGCARRAAS